jgi:Fe-S-cluster-containing dehydrogenase component
MLIDLERCTRCGDCVQACISTHLDGHSRLFLDGPRFGKYLVPSSCRQCRDPVCMIGCPVGSIQQGEDGEIRIREWCIGCGLCADQCPYDSIQMHDAALLPSGANVWWSVDDAKLAGSPKWLEASYRETNWNLANTPLAWGLAMHLALGVNGAACTALSHGKRLYFRSHFHTRRGRPRGERHRLLVTSQGTDVQAYMNGQPLTLAQDAPQKKRFQYACDLRDEDLREGENIFAVSVVPPADFNAMALDARIDVLAPESEEVEEKLVTERAVVCDQCSSLAGDRHACVYACPHEAAMRVDSWVSLPVN